MENIFCINKKWIFLLFTVTLIAITLTLVSQYTNSNRTSLNSRAEEPSIEEAVIKSSLKIVINNNVQVESIGIGIEKKFGATSDKAYWKAIRNYKLNGASIISGETYSYTFTKEGDNERVQNEETGAALNSRFVYRVNATAVVSGKIIPAKLISCSGNKDKTEPTFDKCLFNGIKGGRGTADFLMEIDHDPIKKSIISYVTLVSSNDRKMDTIGVGLEKKVGEKWVPALSTNIYSPKNGNTYNLILKKDNDGVDFDGDTMYRINAFAIDSSKKWHEHSYILFCNGNTDAGLTDVDDSKCIFNSLKEVNIVNFIISDRSLTL